MTTVTPIVQPAREDLLNALQIAVNMEHFAAPESHEQEAFASIERLIRHALAQLSEPNAAAVSAAVVFIRCLPAYGSLDAPDVTEREARDVAAAILNAQLKGTL